MMIAIPNASNLLGLRIAIQGAYEPSPLSLSDALQLSFGR